MIATTLPVIVDNELLIQFIDDRGNVLASVRVPKDTPYTANWFWVEEKAVGWQEPKKPPSRFLRLWKSLTKAA